MDSKHKLKPSTRARYQVVLDNFIGGHSEVALGDISRQLVREWVAGLSRSHAPASVHKSIGVLRQVLAMAVAENRLVVNPVDKVELLPSRRSSSVSSPWSSCTRSRRRRGAPALGVRVGNVWAAVR